MDNEKTYNVSAKRADTGRWWQFGRLEHNSQYDSWRIGMKVTPELIALVKANEGKYVNFSLFEKEEKRDTPPEAKQGIKTLNATAGALLDDSIPFSPRYWF